MTTRPADAPTETAPAAPSTAAPAATVTGPAPAATVTGPAAGAAPEPVPAAPAPAGTITGPAAATPAAPVGEAPGREAPDPAASVREADAEADARVTRRLRWLALGGYFFLLGCLALVVVLVLGDALDGDGRGGPFTDAAFWAVPAGAAIGLVPLAAPRGLLPPVRRTVLVVAQYGAGVLAVLLQIADMV
ncbi:hypothetical protein ACIQRS_08720 [Streptomyces termitum]|uniref:Uncharacterized protein n=1 Tax=Streptomyces termitum TaxID=67368 RepID=A0A918SQP9_9ACTN|nr:hypothetical protein [Streptomyces termitum]GHA64234.1 hypothetical protein GCM10010305_02130 [Streptomyces termitum]